MKLATLCGTILLVGCSGEGAGGGPNELAAQACDDYARSQLADKTYTLDRTALAASMKDAGSGSSALSAPIVIEPGRSSESKQTLECTVRFVEGKESPDVLNMQFIW